MTDSTPRQLKVSIRPGVKILTVLQHLNYKTWYAIAEFVDNSIQSFLDNRNAIERIDGCPAKLRVEIELDASTDGKLIIRDNAGGICRQDYARAFRPAAVPLNSSGLSEFGMGMKSAACWFSPQWSVRTSALGEPVERTIDFNIHRIVEDNIEELIIDERASPPTVHFTEVILTNLHTMPRTSNIRKIKKHLASIYREFLRNGTLELVYDGEQLGYEDVEILRSPSWIGGVPDKSMEVVEWYKRIEFDFGPEKVSGFAAIRAVGSTSEAGFALFRRGRVIEGSGDETYRPSHIFGTSNSYRYQRIFGELHLEGFKVSHTKDGFQWDENEQVFLELLKEELDKEPMPLLRQAETFRSLHKTKDIQKNVQSATDRVAGAVTQNGPPIIERQIVASPEPNSPPRELPFVSELAAQKTIQLEVFGETWEITFELSNEPGIGDWVFYRELSSGGLLRKVYIRLALAHPFMLQFAGSDLKSIEPLQRVAVALVLSEITARESGVSSAGTIRRNINEFLREVLS